jgi:predicted secreted protein
MKRGLSVAGAVLLALVGAAVYATTAVIEWELPTENEDGAAIPLSGEGSIASTTIRYAPCINDQLPPQFAEMVVPAPATSAVLLSLLPARTYCIRAVVTNTFGEVSAESNQVTRVIATPRPRAPVLR